MPTKPKKTCAYPGCPNLTFTLIDECIAHEDKTISFKFKNGYEITK